MRPIASFLIALSVALGTLSALTAYHPRLSSIAAADELVLNGPVGVQSDDPRQPLFEKGPVASPVKLTQEKLGAIAESVGGVGSDAAQKLRVPVREFAWGRWSGRYFFLLACIGLGVGAYMLRCAARNSAEMVAGAAHLRVTAAPDDALRSLSSDVDRLWQSLQTLRSDDERLRTLVHRIDAMQRNQIEAFLTGRQELAVRLGLTGFARLMDAFAGAERMLNRAWSAAADGAVEEAMVSFRVARERLEAALPLLPEKAPGSPAAA